MAEYKRGQPSIAPGSQQLPMGAASAVNAAQPEPASFGVTYATPKDEPDIRTSGWSDDMTILTDPPNPMFAAEMNPNPARVPKSVIRRLPILQAASKDVNAPATVAALFRAVLDQADRG